MLSSDTIADTIAVVGSPIGSPAACTWLSKASVTAPFNDTVCAPLETAAQNCNSRRFDRAPTARPDHDGARCVEENIALSLAPLAALLATFLRPYRLSPDRFLWCGLWCVLNGWRGLVNGRASLQRRVHGRGGMGHDGGPSARQATVLRRPTAP